MKKLTLLFILLIAATNLFAQHINVSVQGGFIFNTPVNVYGEPNGRGDGAFINRGLGVAIQARYQINKKWEAGPIIEYGAVETLYGLSPTYGLVVNRKIQLKKMQLFAGVIGGYLFWQQKEDVYRTQQTGYNIGLNVGCDVPLGKSVSLYVSGGPRYGKVGTRFGYPEGWSGYYYDAAINFPVMVGVQFRL